MLSREEMLWFQACCRSTGMILVASTDTQGGGAPTLPFHGRWLSALGGEGGSAGPGHPSRAAGTDGTQRQTFENGSRAHTGQLVSEPGTRRGRVHVAIDHPPDLGRCFGVSTLRATKVMPTSSSFSPSECSCFSSWGSTGTTTGSEHRHAHSHHTANQRVCRETLSHVINGTASHFPPMSGDRILLSCQLTFRLGLSPPSSLASDPLRCGGTKGTPVSQREPGSRSECSYAVCARRAPSSGCGPSCAACVALT